MTTNTFTLSFSPLYVGEFHIICLFVYLVHCVGRGLLKMSLSLQS